ncbi:MAG: TPM domain-containing protein [Candidatus Omnitrophica bacterium]|nr:TPM domain-containing protein [Candidatus Omnitrophota bacterium]
MRKIAFLIFILLLPLAVFADTLPVASGWVNDYAGVISPEYKERIESVISQLEQKTGAEIVVITVKSISPYDEKEYARMVFDKWKPGKKGKDNGILILLATSERLWRIETGYGIEGALPDGLCAEIGRKDMVPYFKSGEYGKGIYAGVSRIAGIIAGDAKLGMEGLASKSDKENVPLIVYFFLPVFFFIWSLPWPVFLSLPFTLIFAAVFLSFAPVLSILIILGFILSMILRYLLWKKQPPEKRKNFFKMQDFGKGSSSHRGWGIGGGFGGGGGGFGGGFGGGRGGGGGGGGRF